MDFISLYDLMDELASNTAPKYSNSEEARYSEAAADLHQWLMSSTGRPQWLKINKNTRRPVPDNNVSDKGIAMLEHMAGWEGRTHAAYCRYRSELARAEAQGIDESLILPGINQADLMYKGADYLQAMEIGFDKKEISEFIEQYAPKPEIKPDASQRTEPESVKDEGLSIYEQRKEHFNGWRDDSGADIVDLKDVETLKILKQLNKNLWKLTLESYRSEFWNRYKTEYGIRKKQGRRPKR